MNRLAFRLLASLLLVGLMPLAAVSQGTWEPDDCPEYTNKKALKLLDQGTDRKKYKLPERKKYLEQAVDMEEEFAPAYYQLANIYRIEANQKGGSMAKAMSTYAKAIELCPAVHTEPYFHLGMFYMGKEDWQQASEYLTKFYKFSHPDDSKFGRKYERRISESKGALKYANFMHENLSNPKPFNPVLVANVSSEADEYLPLISPDNTKLFFTRKSETVETVRDAVFARENKLFTERFTCAGGANTSFDAGVPLPPPFNEDEGCNYGGSTVSLDNRHLFLTVCSPGIGGYFNCDIYYSHLTYGIPPYQDIHEEQWYWTKLETLGPNVNTDKGWEAQPSISADGNTLYFASARETSDMIDIYYTERNPDNTWTVAEKVPGPINTKRNDKSPFMHSDSETLYFASEGHLGFGGFDVYYTRKDSAGNWMEPTNIGHPINTEGDEHGFVVSTDGKKVYFGSDKLRSKGAGGLDIFTFDLYPEARPEAVVFLKGKVEDAQGVPLRDAHIELKTTHSKNLARFDIDTLDGTYAAVVKVAANDNVVINVEAEGKAFSSSMITAEELGTVAPEPTLAQANSGSDTRPEKTEPTRDAGADPMKAIEAKGVASGASALLMPPASFHEVKFEVRDVKVGEAYALNDIKYTTNSADIDETSQYILNEFIDYLKDHENIDVAIHGHTDDRGDKTDNMVLSTDRAYSVMQYLQKHGIDAGRLSFKGFGPTKPIGSNSTEEGRAKNRRTEFVITSQ